VTLSPRWWPPCPPLLGLGDIPSFSSPCQVLCSSFCSFSMELPDLSFLQGLGVQSVIRDRYGVPVNHFPAFGIKEFYLVASFGRCKYELSGKNVGFLLQATRVALWLILVRNRFLLEYSNFRWLLVMLASISSNSNPTLAIITRSSFISRLMEAPAEFLNIRNLSLRRNRNGPLMSKKSKQKQYVESTTANSSSVLSGANRVPIDSHNVMFQRATSNFRQPFKGNPNARADWSRRSVFNISND
jgi:hypothetical protein